MITTEIERKWLINKFPDLEAAEEETLYVWYLSVDPEVRLRKCGNGYVLCVKGDGTLSREEFQSKVSVQFGEGLSAFIGKEPIKKRMRIYDFEGHKLECSLVDEGRDSSFMYAEIEFLSEEQAKAFSAPHFLGKEITYDKEMKMKNYWRRTRLEK